MPRTLPFFLCLLIVLPLAACKKKPPAAPPEFDSPQRAMTGDASLENRIAAAMELEALSETELAELKEQGMLVGQTAALSRWVAAKVGRGESQEAVTMLVERAWPNLADEVKLADALDLTMGQLEWGACAQLARNVLERRVTGGMFLVRALCMRRSGDAVGATENLAAAQTVDPIAPEVMAVIEELMEERAAGNQLPPSDEARFEVLAEALGERSTVDRLFIKHLTERAAPSWTLGSLSWDDITGDDLRVVIMSRARSYRHCHDLAEFQGKKQQSITGEATFVWAIDGLGRVTEVHIDRNEGWHGPNGDWLDACLTDQFQRLRFPAPRYGRPLPARHRVSFSE